jgi:hypothetical protein
MAAMTILWRVSMQSLHLIDHSSKPPARPLVKRAGPCVNSVSVRRAEMSRALQWLLALAILACAPAAMAENRLFTDTAPMKLTLTAPFGELIRQAKHSTNPYPATLVASENGGAAQTFAIQVSARGLTRRTAGYCSFPPILLTFDKEKTHGTLFHHQHKLKLVTYCRTPADYEQRVVLEYLAYKLYNILTPQSFRVRAVDVTYRDGERDAGTTRFGYLIEDVGDVADRNGRHELKVQTQQVHVAQLNARASARHSLFEFMIGNLDWDQLADAKGSTCCHNSRLIAAEGASAATARDVVPLPYDFDYSGLVDSPYAGPPPGFPTDRVTERIYRGYCAAGGEVPAAIEEFRAHKAEMMAVIANEPRLNASFKAKAARFLEGFYTTINDPAALQREIIKHCRPG